MSIINVNFDDAVEPKPAAAGSYELQITKCDITETGPNSKRPGSPQFKVTIGFIDQPNTPNVQHYVSLPHEEDDSDAANFKLLLLKRFLVLFNVQFATNEIDTEKMAMDMIGATATADVELTEPNDNGDVYNRLRVPKIRGESNGPGRARPPTR